MNKIILKKDGTISIQGVGHVGFWTRHYNGRVDRGVKLGGWQGCLSGKQDSPIFTKRKELIVWLLTEWSPPQ